MLVCPSIRQRQRQRYDFFFSTLTSIWLLGLYLGQRTHSLVWLSGHQKGTHTYQNRLNLGRYSGRPRAGKGRRNTLQPYPPLWFCPGRCMCWSGCNFDFALRRPSTYLSSILESSYWSFFRSLTGTKRTTPERTTREMKTLVFNPLSVSTITTSSMGIKQSLWVPHSGTCVDILPTCAIDLVFCFVHRLARSKRLLVSISWPSPPLFSRSLRSPLRLCQRNLMPNLVRDCLTYIGKSNI